MTKHVFIVDHIGVIVHAMHFSSSSEGEEYGVRLEMRVLDQPVHRGSVSASQPLILDRPIWRADIFRAIGSQGPGFDKAHFHPAFDGVEPVDRFWEPALTSDPFTWLLSELSDLERILERAGASETELLASSNALADAAAEIVALARGLWHDISTGRLTPTTD